MKLSKKLSPAVIESAKPEAAPYRIWDTTVPQLHLRVQPSNVKTWNVQWSRTASKAIGKWPAVTVEMARREARRLLTETSELGAPVKVAKDTVADACRDYVTWLHKEGRRTAAEDADRRFERTVYSDPIGKVRLSAVTQDDMENWRGRIERGELATLPAKRGRPPAAKELSKATVNRMRTPLVAALNRAVSRRKVTPDRAIEWESVKPYQNAGQRREIYLDRQQRRAWLKAADADVRAMMECIALTGCRPGDPAATLRRDYDARHATVRFKTKNHERVIPLSPASKDLFDRLAKDKLPAAPMFTNAGKAWSSSDWAERVRNAATDAGMPDGVVLYTLRHCWITDAIVGGMDLLTVAKLTGTSLSMIEKHYGHLVQGAARDKLVAVSFL